MLGIAIRFLFLLILQLIFVECVIPVNVLSVRKLDSKQIQRKRMDTYEMCRIFENERHRLNTKQYRSKRFKREIAGPKFGGVPTMQEEEVKRVESIIDKLYDDMTENGKPVTYRQRVVPEAPKRTTPIVEKLNEHMFNNSGRKFDFAPAFLLPPDEEGTASGQPPETVPFPWIKKWKHGIIPYFIDPKTYDSGLADVIMSAFDYFEKSTCIRLQRLREKPIDKRSMEKVEWVYITNPMGIRQCVHSNERIPNKGVQMVVFGYDCMLTGEIVHEVMHILGFSHEHTRPDRDEHVSIMWDNIKPGYKKYFEKRSEDPILRLPYDYASVLHYPPRAFSKNGKVTVATKVGVKLGQREGLSETDIEKVALVFGNECVDRNKDYLLTTCPSVVRSKDTKNKIANPNEIQHYFKDRLWPLAIVNYKFRDAMEFSAEERENIKAVIRHIELETCIIFKEMKDEKDEEDTDEDDESAEKSKEGSAKPKNETSNGNKTTANQDPEAEVMFKKNETQAMNDLDDDVHPSTEPPKDEEHTIIEAAATIDEHEITSTKDVPQNENDLESIKILDTDSTPGDDKPKAGARMKRSVKSKHQKKYSNKASKQNTRRHAANVLVFVRSAEPGCRCPPPGKPQSDAVIELSEDCFNSVNDLLHVFVHLLGLDHQHNMHDRDDFLHIVWNKLTPEVKSDMEEKLPIAASVGFAYDYQSVMHYPWLQIKDGVTSIMYPIWNDGWAMGRWQGLSTIDVQKLSMLYFRQCIERMNLDKSDKK